MLLWMDGFDTCGAHSTGNTGGDPAVATVLSSAGYVSAGDVRSNNDTRTGRGLCLMFTANSGNSHDANIRRAFEERGEVIVGFAVRFQPTNLDLLAQFMFDSRLGQVLPILNVYANAQGGISLTIGGSSGQLLAASPPNTIYANVWHYIEVRYRPRRVNGQVVVRVDGAVVISVTGVRTTRMDVPEVVNMLRIGNYSEDFFNANSGSSGLQWVDDLYVCDTLGTAFNDFLGDVVVHAVMPAQDAGPNDMSQFGGGLQHHTAVNEIPPDGDVGYLYSNNVGDREMFVVGDIPANITDVLAVSVHARVKKDAAGAGGLKLLAQYGADVAESGYRAASNQYATHSAIFELAPDLGAWTRFKAENLRFGFEVAGV